MDIYIFGVLVFSMIFIKEGSTFGINSDTDLDDFEQFSKNNDTKLLSRRKRFIIFPDGSSFQLVFCTQTHGYLQVGDIVWFGSTAALAWELPSDPSVFDMFRENSKLYEGKRRSDEKHILYVDENSRVIGKVPYKRRPIVNPAFAKRSADIMEDKTIPRKKMHDMQKNGNYLNSLHEKSIEFHRSGRKSLYVKVEKVLQALGWNGRECVLRMICESSRDMKQQGTFLEEIIRATFTLPKGRDFEEDAYKAYDEAYKRDGHCASLYPACENLHGLQLYDS